MGKRHIFIVNICIICAIIGLSLLYIADSKKDFADTKTTGFLEMAESIAHITSNYINGEQLACDTWTNNINRSRISMDEAIAFIRRSIARKHSSAHIIYIDDGSLQGLSTDPRTDDWTNFSVSYASMDLFPTLQTRNDGIKANITRAFTNPMNGTQSIAFYNRITLYEGDREREALLLRIIPLTTLRSSWVFPTESYQGTEVSLIDSRGDYIIKSKSFKSSNFFEFYKSYNAPDYTALDRFQRGITGYDGTSRMRNSRGEDWLLAHATVDSASGWIIVASMPLTELRARTNDLPLIVIISCGLVLMIVFNVVTMQMFNRQLTLTAEAEKAANRAKSDFLSVMSHDIRTPVNAVLGLDEMILRECSNTTIQDYASDIQSSGKMLLGLINDILDFSKIEAGKMEIVSADYDESDVMSDLVNIISPRAQAKGLSFVVNADSSMPCLLRGDDTRIKQCTLNLLTNAVKYTHAGGVTLNIGYEKADDSHIRIKTQVVDTGIGIKEEDLAKLCSPYERIEESRNRNIEGTGLGMSIVTKLLAAMGSSLVVKSVYGKGSEFSFDVLQEVRDWKELGDWRLHHESAHRNVKHYKESFQAPEAHILIVDDTPMNLTVAKALLKATRIQIDTAADAIAALEKTRASTYNVILIDHMMPQMDGLEMLKKLREESGNRNQNTVCIALTANAMNGAREMYLAVGFEDYITKPIDAKKLEAMLQTYIPDELLLHEGDAGFVDAPADGGNTQEAQGKDPLVYELFGLDSGEALRNCGGADTFRAAVQAFCPAIAENARKIEAFAAEGNWNDYTILVHALKSSARLIGAGELSEEAKQLEAAGNAARAGDAGAMEIIRKDTPALLANYRAYEARLRPLCGQAAPSGPQGGTQENPQEEKRTIDDGMLFSALTALQKALESGDFSYAEEILAELDSYDLPSEFTHTFSGVRKCMQSGNGAAALKLLGVG